MNHYHPYWGILILLFVLGIVMWAELSDRMKSGVAPDGVDTPLRDRDESDADRGESL